MRLSRPCQNSIASGLEGIAAPVGGRGTPRIAAGAARPRDRAAPAPRARSADSVARSRLRSGCRGAGGEVVVGFGGGEAQDRLRGRGPGGRARASRRPARRGRRLQLDPLGAVVVGEEAEARRARIPSAAPCGRSGQPSASTVASVIASASGTPRASASSNQAANCSIGSSARASRSSGGISAAARAHSLASRSPRSGFGSGSGFLGSFLSSGRAPPLRRPWRALLAASRRALDVDVRQEAVGPLRHPPGALLADQHQDRRRQQQHGQRRERDPDRRARRRTASRSGRR